MVRVSHRETAMKMCTTYRNSTFSLLRRNTQQIALVVGAVYFCIVAAGELFHTCNRHPHSISVNCREHDYCRWDFNSRLLIHYKKNNNGHDDAAFCPICNFQRDNTWPVVALSGHIAATALSQTGTILRQVIKLTFLFVAYHIRAPPNSLHTQ